MFNDNFSLRPCGGGPTRDPVREVVGRDQFVQTLQNHLEANNVHMFAPRRIGKTWVLRLLEERSRGIANPIYMDLESVHSLYEMVDKFARHSKLKVRRFNAAVGKIIENGKGLCKATDYEFPWKDHFEEIFSTLNQNSKPTWFLLDEFPVMISNLKNKGSVAVATEVLDHFRYLRQNYPNVKTLLTGSIGLHWIVEELEKTGWRNPLNDQTMILLERLAINDAGILAERLLLGIGQPKNFARDIAVAASGHPFYIQRALDFWRYRDEGEPIIDFFNRIALKPQDPFEFSDLPKRLNVYFGNSANKAKEILNLLSEENLMSVREIKNKIGFSDYIEILNNLEKDGYIQVKNEQYFIDPPLFQKWWGLKIGVAA
jgi:hypothetical protein